MTRDEAPEGLPDFDYIRTTYRAGYAAGRRDGLEAAAKLVAGGIRALLDEGKK